MKHLQLLINLFILGSLSTFISCEKECLDISELDKYTAITKEWVVKHYDNRIITDKNGISQTLIVSSADSISWDDTAEDDCGNIYGSFYNSIQYNTSLSPLNFMFTVHGGSDLEEEFYLETMVTNTNSASAEHKKATYNFYTQQNVEKNSTVTYIDKLTISNDTYYGVLEIVFHSIFSDSDVKIIYYAKQYGLIKFVSANGNEFEVNNKARKHNNAYKAYRRKL